MVTVGFRMRVRGGMVVTILVDMLRFAMHVDHAGHVTGVGQAWRNGP